MKVLLDTCIWGGVRTVLSEKEELLSPLSMTECAYVSPAQRVRR
jgi:hypothetical protein